MDVKKHITALGFIPKNGRSGIYHKVYSGHNNYVISIDFDKEHIEYGDKIIAESKTTQNFSQPENFVVLECVDRLLIQGYKPQNIILERLGHLGMEHRADWIFALIERMVRHICLLNVKPMGRVQ